MNAKDNHGRTALMRASAETYVSSGRAAGQLTVVQALLAANADVNVKNLGGGTALMEASRFGHPDVVQALLAATTDVNAKDNAGETAMSLAAKRGFVEIVQLLKAAASNPDK